MLNSVVLRSAQTVLRDRGWGRGWWYNDQGCVCIGGALCVALYGSPSPSNFNDKQFDQYEEIAGKLVVEIPEGVGGFRGDLYRWNDAPNRTLEEVLTLLERVAVKEEEREHGEATSDSSGQGSDHESDRGGSSASAL